MEIKEKQGLLPNLPGKNDCCGCAVCVDTCAQEAITLQEDEDGYDNR
jgi:Pyruvate/2-oxoacid:ferredoxin oxidoreductase delta subunit